ncbi:MAG: aldo/keto reductase [Geminicoccaceae bacterium]|nr:aldo/keto reductase [Geminicoccaceae bacterium]
MHRRRLGRELEVSAIGLGCMGLSGLYGPIEERAAIALIREAVERGCTLVDTADLYGFGQNERLVGEAIRPVRDRVVVVTKFGNIRDARGRPAVCGRPEYVRRACEASLARLGVEVIDLYYLHRVDPEVPIEDTVGAMAELVREGKVRFLGLSEAAAATIRRAHAVHPITALQTEYSLWTREAEGEILGTCRALGIGFVAYSPLGRGFLTGTIERIEPNDRRAEHPRFAPENLARNRVLLGPLRAVAARRGATPAQVALAWLLAQGPDVVPIPGTRSSARLLENLAATEVALSADDVAALAAAFPPGAAAGARYPEAQLAFVGR